MTTSKFSAGKKTKSNIVEIDKTYFLKMMVVLSWDKNSPRDYLCDIKAELGIAQRRATMKRNASKLSIKRGER